jgi:hypothetical protein
MYRHDDAENPEVCRLTVIVVEVTEEDVIVGAASGAAFAAGAEIPTCTKPATSKPTMLRAIRGCRRWRNIRREF